MPSPTSDPPCIEPKTKMTDDNLTETEEQRRQRERQRNKYLHVALIVEHASRCNSSACRSSNCEKMKSYMKHGLVCTVQAPGGCLLCKRAWTLLRVHSQQCKIDNCHVPQCHAMKKCKRQLQHMSKWNNKGRMDIGVGARYYKLIINGVISQLDFVLWFIANSVILLTQRYRTA